MLSFIKNWFGPKANPIGVDFGSDGLKLAQVAVVDKEYRLVAAASADVPSHVRHDPAARMQFFTQATRELLASGNFQGRQAVLSLPASIMFIQHLRLPKMDEEAMKKAIPWEARGKLPIDPTHALIRHHVAGEVFQDQESKNEVILMAAGRELVNQYLATAAKAHLDVTGMGVEPKVIVDCFGHIYRRKTDADVTNCFIDIGSAGTRAVIARGGHILFARSIPIGGEHFTRAVAAALGINQQDAKLLRIQLAGVQPAATSARAKQEIEPAPALADGGGFAVLDAALAAAGKLERRAPETVGGVALAEAPRVIEPTPQPAATDDLSAKALRVDQACREPVAKLVEELDLCRRYYEATFPSRPVDRLIFVGGEARHRVLCQGIAEGLGIAAQVGDPLVRMGRTTEVGLESGMDRRQPQPGWVVAIGLSLGAPSVDERREQQ